MSESYVVDLFYFLTSTRNFTCTNLKKHLEHSHWQIFLEFQRIDDELKGKKTTSKSSCGAKSQVTLQESISKSKPFTFDHPQSIKIHRAIGEMVCVDSLPISIVDKPGFRCLLHTVEPRYTPCSRTYLSETLIPGMYDRVKARVSKLLDVMSYVSLTTDLWSSQAQDAYLSLTAHWIDEAWERKEGCLHAQIFNDSHTGEHIKNVMLACIDKWKIGSKLHLVLRDNGSNFIAGLRLAGIPNFGCLAHTLQLVVKDAVLAQRSVEDLLSRCRKIVGHFKQSNVAWHNLASIQEKLGFSTCRPVQEQATRWNSSFYMLSWIVNQKQALLAVSAEISLPYELTTTQWKLAETVVHVLQPFEEATKEISYSSASVSIIIPIVNALIKQMQNTDESEGIKSMKRQLLTSLLSRFENIESNKFLAIASFLDPRYKLRCFSSSSKAAAARQMVLEEFEKQPLLSQASDHQSPPPSKVAKLKATSSLLSSVQELLEQSSHSSDHEMEPDSPEVAIDAYLKEPNLPMYESVPNPIDPDNPTIERNDPLIFWKNNETAKPILSRLARRYLSAPPGSVPSERLFSLAGDIANNKRNRLLPDKVEMLLFLKKNLVLLQYDY